MVWNEWNCLAASIKSYKDIFCDSKKTKNRFSQQSTINIGIFTTIGARNCTRQWTVLCNFPFMKCKFVGKLAPSLGTLLHWLTSFASQTHESFIQSVSNLIHFANMTPCCHIASIEAIYPRVCFLTNVN